MQRAILLVLEEVKFWRMLPPVHIGAEELGARLDVTLLAIPFVLSADGG